MSAWPGDPVLRYDPPRTVPRHRILVVDDHPPMAIAFARLIQVLGHEVRITHDGATAPHPSGVASCVTHDTTGGL